MTTTIHLPHSVIAPAAAAMETALHFELVDPIELQSYRIEPVGPCFALIGRHGDDIHANPAAAYIAWNDAHFIATVHEALQLIYIHDVTANILCNRIGDTDTASLMFPILRGSRTAFQPNSNRLGDCLRDTVFETESMRAARSAALFEKMDAEGLEVDVYDESCTCESCLNCA